MIPSGGHDDWLFGLLKWIPRRITAVAGPPPTNIVYSPNFDRAHHNADVPNDGAWAVSEHPKYGLSFAAVVEPHFIPGWWLIAIGTFRYDYVSGYFTFPRFAVKKVK